MWTHSNWFFYVSLCGRLGSSVGVRIGWEFMSFCCISCEKFGTYISYLHTMILTFPLRIILMHVQILLERWNLNSYSGLIDILTTPCRWSTLYHHCSLAYLSNAVKAIRYEGCIQYKLMNDTFKCLPPQPALWNALKNWVLSKPTNIKVVQSTT